MTSALVPLAPYEAGGWVFSNGAGYYIHQGYVYLTGLIESTAVGGGPPVTQAILTGLPAEIRPATTVNVSLPIDPFITSDAANPALELPTVWPAAVNPDGTMALTIAVPLQVNTTPDPTVWFYYTFAGEQQPQYVTPLALALFLGGVRWPLGGLPPPDTFATLPLAPFLGASFTDIDSAYAIHGTRVHLAGHVQASEDNATQLLNTLPGGATDGLPTDGATTQDHSGKFGIYVAADRAHLVGEHNPLKPVSQSPPVSIISPAYHGSNLDPAIGGQNFRTPRSADTSWYTGWDAVGGEYARNDVAPYTCTTLHSDGTTFHVDYGRSPTQVGPGFSFSVADLIALVSPEPDWFFLTLHIGVEQVGGYGTCCQLKNFLGEVIDTKGPGWGSIDDSNVWFAGCPTGPGDMTIVATGADLKLTDGSAWTAAGDSNAQIGDYGTTPSILLGPQAPEYTGPFAWWPPSSFTGGIYAGWSSLPTGLAWSKDQAATTIGIDWTDAALIGGTVPGEPAPQIRWQVSIFPLFDLRQDSLHNGDVLDLTGAGWEGVLPVPSSGITLTPGTIAAGQPLSGIRPRGRKPLIQRVDKAIR